MSTNAEIVKNAIDAYFALDGQKLASYLHPNIQWFQQDGHPIAGVYKGIDEVFDKVFQRFPELWSQLEGEVTEIKSDGNRVFVSGRIKGTSAVTGRYMDIEFLTRYTVENGLITEYKQFTDTFVMDRTIHKDRPEVS